MPDGDLAERLPALLAEPDAEPGADVVVDAGNVPPCVDVPPSAWVAALTACRDELGLAWFDWLSAVDEGEDGFAVVAHLWAPPADGRPLASLLVRTRVPRAEPVLPTAVGVFAGAAWHERETAEMFGLGFAGHDDLRPLLLPDGFEGHPLRKEFVLASRVAKAWPGAKEPGESDADLAGGEPAPAAGRPGRGARRRTVPPGVPDPSWGPRPPAGPAGGAAEGDGDG
ncbi:MAG TPA: NADH-quinone oxidoreductase subunit C [Motilibacteraceae bacterium]|nr:NADH-quinone oxidoreductase subunit C [Motilibacteraceae bacterium]